MNLKIYYFVYVCYDIVHIFIHINNKAISDTITYYFTTYIHTCIDIAQIYVH